MDKRLKSTKLYEAVIPKVRAQADKLNATELLVYAVCLAVTEASSKKGGRAAAGKSAAPLPFTASQLYDHLKVSLPEQFIYAPLDNTWFSRLNKLIPQMNLPPETPQKLEQYFRVRGANWKRLSFGVLVQNFKKWALEAVAEEYGKQSGQPEAGNLEFLVSGR